jgi:flagellar basal-body rod protein FlgC
MNLFGVMDVSASALQAERLRAEVVASNMANANTTRTPQGGPYKRQQVVFESQANDQGAFANHFLSQGAGFNGNGLEINDPESRGDIGGVKIAAATPKRFLACGSIARKREAMPEANSRARASTPLPPAAVVICWFSSIPLLSSRRAPFEKFRN